MKFAARVVVISTATAAVVSPAYAAGHWSYAQWGTTPNELIAASGGEARPHTPQPGDHRSNAAQLAVARFSQDGIDYDVQFLFSKPWLQLQAIDLVPDPARCEDVKIAFAARLGEPKIDRREYAMGSRKALTLRHNWVDAETGEHIAYDQMAWDGEQPANCRVTYSPG